MAFLDPRLFSHSEKCNKKRIAIFPLTIYINIKITKIQHQAEVLKDLCEEMKYRSTLYLTVSPSQYLLDAIQRGCRGSCAFIIILLGLFLDRKIVFGGIKSETMAHNLVHIRKVEE